MSVTLIDRHNEILQHFIAAMRNDLKVNSDLGMDPPADYGPMYKDKTLGKRTPDGVDDEVVRKKDRYVKHLNFTRFHLPAMKVTESAKNAVVAKFVNSNTDNSLRISKVLDSYKSLAESRLDYLENGDTMIPAKKNQKNKDKDKDKIKVAPVIQDKELV